MYFRVAYISFVNMFCICPCVATSITFTVANEGFVLDPQENYVVNIRFKAIDADPINPDQRCMLGQINTLYVPKQGQSHSFALPATLREVKVYLGLGLRHSPILKPLSTTHLLPASMSEIRLLLKEPLTPSQDPEVSLEMLETDPRTSN